MSRSDDYCKNCGSGDDPLTWDVKEQDGYFCCWCLRFMPIAEKMSQIIELMTQVFSELQENPFRNAKR